MEERDKAPQRLPNRSRLDRGGMGVVGGVSRSGNRGRYATPVSMSTGAPSSPAFVVARRARGLLSRPSGVAVIFWTSGAVAVFTALLVGHWPRRSVITLAVVAGTCVLAAGIRFVAGRRLASWTLHVDVGAATACISVLAVVGVAGDVPFADLYVWVVLFAALYFRPLGALAHVAAAGTAYALVLAFGPGIAAPVQAWFGVFGTAGVAGAIVLGLVSVLRSAAADDPLTGCANRRSWDERLEEEMERSRRTGQPLSIAMIDLDAFKTVNDRGGHRAGDLLLQEVAQRWRGTVRDGGDFLARLGGDEFAILAPGSDETGIRRLGKRLAEALPAGISASIGVATWDRTESAGALLRRADQAMYKTKQRRPYEGFHSA